MLTQAADSTADFSVERHDAAALETLACRALDHVLMPPEWVAVEEAFGEA